MNKNTGGPAFPLQAEGYAPDFGMTLRDWFAGQALTGLDQGATSDIRDDLYYQEPSHLAKRAYAIADAMIAEREK